MVPGFISSFDFMEYLLKIIRRMVFLIGIEILHESVLTTAPPRKGVTTLV
jgi:hypothetical protein